MNSFSGHFVLNKNNFVLEKKIVFSYKQSLVFFLKKIFIGRKLFWNFEEIFRFFFKKNVFPQKTKFLFIRYKKLFSSKKKYFCSKQSVR